MAILSGTAFTAGTTTLTTAAAATLATEAAIIGTATSAYGMYQQGKAADVQAKSAQNVANYNAAVAEQQAEAERQKATFEQKRQAERAARIKSAQEVGLAKAGGLGSPVAGDLAAEQAAELELENLLIGYEGEVGARRAGSQATLDRLQGRIYRQKGESRKTASYYGAGSTLLTGFGSAIKPTKT